MGGNNPCDTCCTAHLIRQAYDENARLRAELQKLKEQLTPSTSASPTPAPEALQTSLHCRCRDQRTAIGDGSGCASPKIYRDMLRTNWHGRLGRVHMADVDNMDSSQLSELDTYLHRTIKEMFPRGGGMAEWRKDTVFASLKDLGLRLEDRMGFADAEVFDDGSHAHASTISRMRNFSAAFYHRDHSWKMYWNGYALETLVELARYRGLFTSEGMMKESLAG